MELYLHFILDMARSPGFGSMATDSIRALNTRFRFASGTQYLKLASYYNSPDRSTKSTTPPFNGLCLLVSTRFQVLFHSPPGVLFTFPSRYCSTIGHQVVFRLGGWSPRLPTGFLVSRGLWIQPDYDPFQIRGSHTLWPAFPCRSFKNRFSLKLSVTPKILLPSVWPLPLSLATTRGISVDVFSSPYLDVSVQAVPFLYLFDSVQDTLRWVSPFGNLRITAHLQLPEAYRSLSRPSSAPDAKAFPLRSL